MIKAFVAGQKVAHLLAGYSEVKSMCGRNPWPGFFLGTRAGIEREQVKDMPVCVDCIRKARGEL